MTKSKWISAKIASLMGEGKPQPQAVAIAYSMWEQNNRKQEGGLSEANSSEDFMKNLFRSYPINLENMPMAQQGVTTNAYGIPTFSPNIPYQQGFYPTQGSMFPNSVSYGKKQNPNYGMPVTATNGNPNWGKSVNTTPSQSLPIPQIPTNTQVPQQSATPKVNKTVPKKEVETPVARTPLTYLESDLKSGKYTYGTAKEQLQASAEKAMSGVIGGDIEEESNANNQNDWIKYNILNPYNQGMDLNTSLAYTGQQFGKGNVGMGIAGAGLSALKGVRSFLSGYSSGKGQNDLENQQYYNQFNRDEDFYMQQGGKTNADLLTGNYITEDGQQAPNIEVEDGEHVKNSQTGEVQEAVGDKHVDGGIPVNLPDESKVLSDYTKIGASNTKRFEEMFDIKLKAADTFATVLDKYNNKIGVKKLEEEEKEILEKLEKNSKGSIDKTTQQINEDFLAQEIAEISKKKQGLNKLKAEAFEAIFKEQEKIPKKGDGTKVLDKSGNPIKQEGGEQQTQGQPNPQQVIQAYAQMAGQDPNEVMQQLQQLSPEEQQQALQQMIAALQQGQQSSQEEQAEGQMSNAAEEGQEQPMMQGGGYTKEQQAERLNDFYNNAKGLGYEGAKDIGSIQKYMATEHPEEVIKYFTENGQPLTAKHIDLLKENYKSSFKAAGVDPKKDSADYTTEEKLRLQSNISSRLEGDKPLYKDFLLQGFQDNKWDWRAPMLGIKSTTTSPIVSKKQVPITAPNMSRYFSTSEVPTTESTVEGVVGANKPVTKEPIRNILSTEGMPYIMPPSAPTAPYLQQVDLSLLESQKGSVENQLAASENARQAAYEATRGLPPAQAAAMMANYLATSGQQDTAGIAQQEQQDLGNKARIEQYNASQADKEQILNEQLKKQYEREAFGTLNTNEQSWRNYYDANQANRQALSDKIDRRNIMNLGLTNYQLNGSGGFDFVNKSPFQGQDPQAVAYTKWFNTLTPEQQIVERKKQYELMSKKA